VLAAEHGNVGAGGVQTVQAGLRECAVLRIEQLRREERLRSVGRLRPLSGELPEEIGGERRGMQDLVRLLRAEEEPQISLGQRRRIAEYAQLRDRCGQD